jgi:predicted Fe-Mo cluster-binding NifX family protein
MVLRFAFAVNRNNEFEDRHFGDSEQFSVYEWDGEKFTHLETISNTLKEDDDDHHHHGDNKKGKGITKLLKEKGVKVLVSKQFGRNIKIIDQKFVPVITVSADIDEVQKILPERIPAIMENIQSKPEHHKMVDLRK